MFSGSIPALVTPFRDGALDERALRRLVDWQIEEGSAALVPCGTTGEASTLSNDEHHRVIELVIEQAAGRVPVIAGCGSNDTASALAHLRFAAGAGAAAGLCVVPYYNKPSQGGLLAHFGKLAEEGGLPIVLYNVPGRTVTDIASETVCELVRRFPERVMAIKDASEDLARVTEHRLGAGEGFCQLSGNDELALPFMAAGGSGCISVTANVAPAQCAAFQRACAAGNWAEARHLNDALYPLHRAMFADASPAPAKYALAKRHDWLADEVRLPLCRASEAARAAVEQALGAVSMV